MADGWGLVAQVRNDAADLVESLSADQRRGPTLCSEWTPHEVLAHLVVFVAVPLPRFMFGIAKARGDYDLAADRMAKAMAELPVEELAAKLRSRAAKKSALPMFPPEMTLSDVAIHTQDIRRGLELDGGLDADVVRTALVFLTEHKQAKAILDPEKLEGVRLVATDIDWQWGSGAEISGLAEPIMMAIAGRPTLEELEGDIDRLR